MMCVQLGVHQDSWVLFCKAVFQLGGPQHVQVPEAVPPQIQDFSSLKFMGLFSAHFSNLLSLWMAAGASGESATSPQVCVICKLMRMLNRTS